MRIEDEVFKRCAFQFDRLLAYGFQYENAMYVYSKYIMHDNFRMDITISKDGKLVGRLHDMSFDEEYTNFRIKTQAGEFIAEVREQFENILLDIKEQCTIQRPYLYDQTNRISKRIMDVYQDEPEFLWERTPGCGVYRNKENQKWYAIIMDVERSKLDQGEEKVEIINVKLEEEYIQSLLQNEGYYPAYHMNKKKWISIILDDTIEDDKIVEYIKDSHAFTITKSKRKQEEKVL